MTRVLDKEKVLVVDDAKLTVEVISRNLTSQGYRVFTASKVEEAINVLDSTPIDLVITDLMMPGVNGMELVKHVRQHFTDTEVIMITGYATVEGAVEAVKAGAEEYLAKPFTDDELLLAVDRAFDNLNLRRIASSRSLATPRTPMGFIGDSDAMKHVYRTISKAARTSATALIQGESGTGKELVARAIHYNSPRASAPFVAVNCGGIPEGLLESELFGHVKGSFTGATETRAGFFQTADGGTIFLDEVSETSLTMQVKLLRVLQEKEICMLGSSRAHVVDVRILAATNRKLDDHVKKGGFREDLFYRLNVIEINLPSLRDRLDDIALLINHFVEKFAREDERELPRFTESALRVLQAYHWPGNVRELENVVHRLLVMTDGDSIDVPDLPSLMLASRPRDLGLNRTLAEVESDHIRNVLVGTGGNKTKAAEILGIDRKTLREKLKRVSIDK